MSPENKSAQELREELEELKEKPDEAPSEKKLRIVSITAIAIVSILLTFWVLMTEGIWIFLYFSLVTGTLWVAYFSQEKKYILALLAIGITLPIGVQFFIHSPGTVVDTIPSPGNNPTGLAWDGSNLWSADSASNIYKVNPNDGTVERTISTDIDGNQGGLTWVEGKLFYGNDSPDAIFVIDADSEEIEGSLDTPGPRSMGLAWGDGHLWNLDFETTEIYKINISNNEIITRFSFPGTEHTGLAWSDGYVWSADMATNRIYKLEPPIGEARQTLHLSETEGIQGGLAWGDDYLWFSRSDKLLKISTKYWFENLLISIPIPIIVILGILSLLQPIFAYPLARGARKVFSKRVENRRNRIQEIESEIHQDRFKKQRSRENLKEIERKVKEAEKVDVEEEFPDIMKEAEELLKEVKESHENGYYNKVLDLYSENQKKLRKLESRIDEVTELKTADKVEEIEKRIEKAKEMNVDDIYPDIISQAEELYEEIQEALDRSDLEEIDNLYSQNRKLMRKIDVRIEEVREMEE